MSDEAIEANQVLRSWVRNGIIHFERTEKVIDALKMFDVEYKRVNQRGKTVGEGSSESPAPGGWETDGSETADDELFFGIMRPT
ncbi:hypothetical protein BJ508DRAFT_418289 [Ascobolus immersus RN42]|uniref:Uncharacterized protein n=1 Tax=Ascobolus immersus RN42 TaxID=1160509 RepID=A0A3N4HMS8_ASCIM|nr:hypothetical protein BJ508DRAFT_418289 [Ascobolus immersus RN42]